MASYLDYMDKIHSEAISDIKSKQKDWIVDKINFTIYRLIKPIASDISFKSVTLLRKKARTSVMIVQDYNGRQTKLYFSEYKIIETLIFLYDSYEDEGGVIYEGLIKLVKNIGSNISFEVDDKKFTFKGLLYLSQDKNFMTFTDYEISINDFICLLNLVIEKDRYNNKSENGKATVSKYLLFTILCSKRAAVKQKAKMVEILKMKKIYDGQILKKYKNIINRTGESKLFIETELLKKSI